MFDASPELAETVLHSETRCAAEGSTLKNKDEPPVMHSESRSCAESCRRDSRATTQPRMRLGEAHASEDPMDIDFLVESVKVEDRARE